MILDEELEKELDEMAENLLLEERAKADGYDPTHHSGLRKWYAWIDGGRKGPIPVPPSRPLQRVLD